MAIKKIPLLLLVLAFLSTNADKQGEHFTENKSGVGTYSTNVQSEAKPSGDLVGCQAAMKELGPCSNQLVHAFLHGQNRISPECCQGMSSLIGRCGSTIASLGLTVQEGTSILASYCDASPPAYPPSNPAASPDVSPMSAQDVFGYLL